VQLHHLAVETLGDGRHERHLEGPRGDHDLIGLVAAVVELDHVDAARPADGADRTVQLHRQVEVAGVVGQVFHDLVPAGVAVRITGKGQAGQSVVAGRREQLERVPTLAPRPRRLGGRFQDREVTPLLCQEVADRETGLATTDHDHLMAPTGAAFCHSFRLLLPTPARRASGEQR
jgi:hypothetical protein